MRQTLAVIGALVLGILIGVGVPYMFGHHVDTSWQTLLTKSESFGISYGGDWIFSDLPMPEIRSVTGKAKFIDSIGPGQTTELGYIITVEMAALDLSKVPQRYKEEKKVLIDGYETTSLGIDQASYEIQFDFDLKDKDGFTLKILHAEGLPPLVSGTKNVFQAKVDEPIACETAAKLHNIWVYPIIKSCHTCLPPS